MIKSHAGTLRVSRRTGGRLAIALLGGIAAVALISPGGASASYARCHGTMALDKGVNINDPNGIDYSFYCSKIIHAYTITSTSPVDFFGAGPLVYSGTNPNSDPVDGNSGFTCEGATPSFGFGCNGTFIPGSSPPKQGGTTAHGEAVVGQFVTDDKLCATHHKPRPKVWFSVVETEFDTSGNPFQTSSGPFKLRRTGCQAAAGGHRRHRHHHH